MTGESAGTSGVVTDRATAGLLWASCHRSLEPRVVFDALEAGADVEMALRAAARHRIIGLLWRAMEDADALDALGQWRDGVEELVELHRLRDLLLVPQALERALVPLVHGGLEPLVLKGPTVGRCYPDVGLRLYDDLDILLPRRQHEHALRLLHSAGWKSVRNPARDRYDSVLVHDDVPFLPLELHYGLDGWYDRANNLSAEGLWSRRVPIELSGVPAFGLPLPENLVMLSSHAAKPYHGFDRLVWIADFAMVIGQASEQGDEVDWDRVRSLSSSARCTTAVAVALSLAGFAGAAVPDALFAPPVQRWRASALATLMDETWALHEESPIHLRFALADRWTRRAWLLVGSTHGFPPVASVVWYLRSIGWTLRRFRSLHVPSGHSDQ